MTVHQKSPATKFGFSQNILNRLIFQQTGYNIFKIIPFFFREFPIFAQTIVQTGIMKPAFEDPTRDSSSLTGWITGQKLFLQILQFFFHKLIVLFSTSRSKFDISIQT